MKTEAPPTDVVKFANAAKFGRSGHLTCDFVLETDIGTPINRMLDPDYWRTIASRPDLSSGSIIRVLSESPPVFLELLVRRVNAFAKLVDVVPLRRVDLPDANAGAGDDGLPPNHSIRYLGPASKWTVLRESQVLKSGFESKAEALEFTRQLGRAA